MTCVRSCLRSLMLTLAVVLGVLSHARAADYTFNYATDYPTGTVNQIQTAAHGLVNLVDGDRIILTTTSGADFTDGSLSSRRLRLSGNISVDGTAVWNAGAVWRGDVPLTGSALSTSTGTDLHRFTLPIVDSPTSPSLPQPNGKGFQAANGGILAVLYQWTPNLWASSPSGGGLWSRGHKGRLIACANVGAVSSTPWGFFYDPATGQLDLNIPGTGTTPFLISRLSVIRGNAASLNLWEIGGSTVSGQSWKKVRFANADLGNTSGGGYAIVVNPANALDNLMEDIEVEGWNYHALGFVTTQNNLRNTMRRVKSSSSFSPLTGGATAYVFYGGTAAGNSFVDGCVMEDSITYLDGGYLPSGAHHPGDAGVTLRSIVGIFAHSPTNEARVKGVVGRRNTYYHDHLMWSPWGGPRSASFLPPSLSYGTQTVTPPGDPTIYENMAFRLEDETYYGVICWNQGAGTNGLRRCKLYGPANFNTGLTTPADLNRYWPSANVGGFFGPATNTKNATFVAEFNEVIGAWRPSNVSGFLWITTGQSSLNDSAATGAAFVANNRLTFQGNTLINNVAAADVGFVGLIGSPSGSPGSGTQGLMPTTIIFRDNIVAAPNAASKHGLVRDQFGFFTTRSFVLQTPIFSGNWFPNIGLTTALISSGSTNAGVGTGISAQTNLQNVTNWQNQNNDTNFTPGPSNVWNVAVNFTDPTVSGQLASNSPVLTTVTGATGTPMVSRLNGRAASHAGAYGYTFVNGRGVGTKGSTIWLFP